MTDNWEDWEADNFILPVLQEKQLKQLEERRLVEESDYALSRQLFTNEEQNSLEKQEIFTPPLKAEKVATKRTLLNKQLENEKRQKEISKKNKEDKIRNQKASELYGESEEDLKYQEYEDMFY
jgi:hypothetical protein